MLNFKLILGLVLFSTMAVANPEPEHLSLIELLKSDNLIDDKQYQQFKEDIGLNHSLKSNKALNGSASINGTVQDSNSLLESQHVELIEIVNGNATVLTSTNTDVTGSYSFTSLNAGVYVVYVGSYTYDDYLDYMWNSVSNIVCQRGRCDIPTTSHINLALGETINNIDFTLELGGVITGSVREAGTEALVNTLAITLTNTDNNVNYSLQGILDNKTGNIRIGGIPDGDYIASLTSSSWNTNIHIPQIFGGPECNRCTRLVNSGIGTILSITNANTINNIDFLVNVGASISGSVLDASTLNPLNEFALIAVYDELNTNVGYIIQYGTNWDPAYDGSYTVGGLLPGAYYVQAGDVGQEFYLRELYSNRPCFPNNCIRGSGDPVVIGSQENVTDINFLLEKGGKISGTVIDANSGLPIPDSTNKQLQVEFYDASESVVGVGYIRNDGTYKSRRAIPAGSYAVRTGSMYQGVLTSPFVNQKYNAIDCAGVACDLSTSDVQVTTGVETTGINFSLSEGYSFSGIITDLNTNIPIPNVHVLVYRDMGAGVVKFANWATTSDGSDAGGPAIGSFEVTGLPAGTYYARTNNGSDLPFFESSLSDVDPQGWIDILYSNISCPDNCDVTQGTPILLGPNRIQGTTIDFNLTKGGTISGKVIDSEQNGPISEITINIYDDNGDFISSTVTDELGNYISKGLNAGTYYLTTSSYDLLVDVVYGNEYCIDDNCNPLNATPIQLNESEQKTDIGFILKARYRILFKNGFE